VAAGNTAAGYFHKVTLSNSSDADSNGDDLDTAMSGGSAGTYFVDGDVNIKSSPGAGQAVISTGYVYVNPHVDLQMAAAVTGYGWGFGMSLFTDKDPSADAGVPASSKCPGALPGDPDFHPVVRTDNQAGWYGSIYAPHGVVSVEGNSNNKPQAPVFANGLQVGTGANANSIALGKCAACFTDHPPIITYTTGLVQ